MVARVTSIRARLLGRSKFVAVRHDALNGRKVCTALLSRVACWYGNMGPLQGMWGQGEILTICCHVDKLTPGVGFLSSSNLSSRISMVF